MMGNLIDNHPVVAFLLILLAMTLVITGCVIGFQPIGHYGCEQQTQDMGYESRYGFWTGCQIKLEDGRWIPLDSYYYQERP